MEVLAQEGWVKPKKSVHAEAVDQAENRKDDGIAIRERRGATGVGKRFGGVLRFAEPRAYRCGDRYDHREAERAKSEHRSMPGAVIGSQDSGEERTEEAANAVAKIDRADGRGAVAGEIVRCQREHGGRQHGHADALRGQTEEHADESRGDGGEGGRSGEDGDADQQDRLAGETAEKISGRQAGKSQAQGKDGRKEASVAEREAEVAADVGGKYRKLVTVRGH